MARYKHLFGPVPSRRFGRSLGIDLTPFKTCSFDCIFCQLGHTTVLTADRSQHVPLKQVFDELDDWKKNDGVADILTLAGSGEPTLHSGFGEVIEHARSLGLPVALLTNGSLLHLPEVRKAAAGADIVKVSLSACKMKSCCPKISKPRLCAHTRSPVRLYPRRHGPEKVSRSAAPRFFSAL